MRQKLEEIRCGDCRRKLAEGLYTRLEIKCPRCGTHNVLRAGAADHSSQSPTPERPGASHVGSNNDKALRRPGAP
ncbi:MAG: Com family DNA-binding transcriptional regulator [Burkholderiaceae bacterium]|nr:Com family DNA-binding transcriptional regulator [Burkholderiaceae bacterium]